MAKIPGSVPVAGFIAPTDGQDVYPATDPLYQKGGWREVATVEEMNAIPVERRREGMIVAVTGQDPTVYYEYRNDTFNEKEFGGGNVDLSNYYNKQEVDDKLKNLDLENYYTKDEIDNNHYTKTEVDDLLQNVEGQAPDLSGIKSEIKEIRDKADATQAELDDTQLNVDKNTQDIADLKNQIAGIDVEVLVDETTISFNGDKELYAKPASNTNPGVIQTDNTDTWVEGGILKIKKTEPDLQTIEYNTENKLTLSGALKEQITKMQETIDLILGGVPPDMDQLPIATLTRLGISRPDGVTVTIKDGVLSTNIVIPEASPVVKGIVKGDEKTITVQNGVMSVKDMPTKFTDLKDVEAVKLEGHAGKVVTVGDNGKLTLKYPGEPTIQSVTKAFTDTDNFVSLYNLSKVAPVAAQAMLKVVATSADPIEIMYKGVAGNSYTGEEYTETVGYSITRLLPVLELNTEIFIKGKCKATLSVTIYGG